MRKLAVILAAALGVVGCLLLYAIAHGQADRQARLMGARSVLRQAYDDYLATGRLPASNGTWEVFAYTNQVRVGVRAVQLAVATTPGGNPSVGLFAMTATRELIWLSGNRRPVLLSDSNYTVPLWRDGY